MTDEPEYGLVMPFVAVASKGGPYEDAAYVAGYEMGLLDATLAVGLKTYEVTVHSANAGQADLIAMRNGYRSTLTVSDEHPQWTFATFELAEEDRP